MKHDSVLFAQSYQKALQRHLSSRSRERSSSRLACALGRDAANADIDVMDLVRIHDQAMLALDPPAAPTAKANAKRVYSPSGLFLLEALRPLEEKRKNALKSSNESQKTTRMLLDKEVHRHSQLLKKSNQLQLQSQRLAHMILMAQEEERKEISRDLHDGLVQVLAGINLHLSALKVAGAINNGNIDKNILQAQRLVKESVTMVHSFARRLRPGILDDLGLIPALRSYIRELPERKSLDIRFTAMSEIEKLDNIRRTVLYRVAQEALLNVVRHAHAELATVTLKKIGNQALLEIHDNGKSFRVDCINSSIGHQRLGLLGMRERVEMVQGKFSIVSKRGGGTTVRAEIPFTLVQK